MVAPESNLANTMSAFPLSLSTQRSNTNPLNIYTERPVDTAVNIHQGRPTIETWHGRDSQSSSVPHGFIPSEMDYAERVASQNNMEVEDNDPIPSQEGPPGPGLDKPTVALAPAYNYNVATTIPTPPHAETSFQPAPPDCQPLQR